MNTGTHPDEFPVIPRGITADAINDYRDDVSLNKSSMLQ